MDDARQNTTWPLRFRIFYCGPCGYEPHARELAAELEVRFGAEVELEEGRFGQFDVRLDGKLVASKGGFWRRVTVHGAPPQDRLLAAIAKHLAVRDGDVCEIDPVHQHRSAQACTMKNRAVIRPSRKSQHSLVVRSGIAGPSVRFADQRAPSHSDAEMSRHWPRSLTNKDRSMVPF
jgi:selT/selW/selH-like putative selenoprotein